MEKSNKTEKLLEDKSAYVNQCVGNYIYINIRKDKKN